MAALCRAILFPEGGLPWRIGWIRLGALCAERSGRHGVVAELHDPSGNKAAGGAGSCTLFCGTTGAGEKGAGIYNAGNPVVVACYRIPNSATSGGGIWSVGNSRIGNSIVAGNSGGVSPDASGSFVSDGFNLIGRRDGSAGFTAIGDQTGTIAAPLDPKLGPLQDNGGPTGPGPCSQEARRSTRESALVSRPISEAQQNTRLSGIPNTPEVMERTLAPSNPALSRLDWPTSRQEREWVLATAL